MRFGFVVELLGLLLAQPLLPEALVVGHVLFGHDRQVEVVDDVGRVLALMELLDQHPDGLVAPAVAVLADQRLDLAALDVLELLGETTFALTPSRAFCVKSGHPPTIAQPAISGLAVWTCCTMAAASLAVSLW